MSKSDEEEIPSRIDYSEIPEEIKQELEPGSEGMEETAKISHDGRQHVVRIPTKISKVMNISKGQKIKFKVEIPEPERNEDFKLTMDLIQNVEEEEKKSK